MGRKQRSKQQGRSAPAGGAPGTIKRSASRTGDNDDFDADPTVVSILKLPRIVRMIVIAFPALAATIIFTPVVDAIYLRFFYTPETKVLPSLITSGLALIVYVVGWVLVVGTPGEKPQEYRAIKWYLIACIFLMLFAALWFGYLMIDSLQA